MVNHRFLLVTAAFATSFLLAEESNYEKGLIGKLNTYTRSYLPANVLADLEKLATAEEHRNELPMHNPPPLLREYPALQKKIPYIALCDLPTPLLKADAYGFLSDLKSFYIKNDGVTGPVINGQRLFSGNKPRKLEFLLGDALTHNAKSVLTFGCLASSHALATAVYAKKLGMQPICMLRQQANSHAVRRTLLLQLMNGTKLRYNPTRALHAMATADEFLQAKQKYGQFPYIIPTGGSCPLGALGFVNAIFELRDQIKKGLMPEPDYIFDPIGSAGTATGLLLGIKAAGLKSRLIAIHIEPEEEPQEMLNVVKKMYPETNALLHQADPSFPLIDFTEKDFEVVTGFGGDDYGLFTPEAMAAKKLLKETENLELDGTYTAKAWVGMMHYIEKNKLHDKTILFWNTYDAGNYPELSKLNYKDLPEAFHAPFEQDVQPLDQD